MDMNPNIDLINQIKEEVADWPNQPLNERVISEETMEQIKASGHFIIDDIAKCLMCGRLVDTKGFATRVINCLTRPPHLRSRSCASVFNGDASCLPLREQAAEGELELPPIEHKLQVSSKEQAILAKWMGGTLPLNSDRLAKPIPNKLFKLLTHLAEQGPQILTIPDVKYCGALHACAGGCLSCFQRLIVGEYGARVDFYDDPMSASYLVPDPVKSVFNGIGNYRTPLEERVRVFASALPQNRVIANP